MVVTVQLFRTAARRPSGVDVVKSIEGQGEGVAMNMRRALAAVGVPLAMLSAAGIAWAAGIGPGITTPTKLKPFVFSTRVGAKPHLPSRIAYVQDSPNQTEVALSSGLKAGAAAAGLKYLVSNSNGDPQAEVQNMQSFLTTGTGALVVGPVDPTAQAPAMVQAMGQGVDMDALVFGPATDQVNASQYQVGRVLALAAANYIKTKLGGTANVVILNQDNVPSIVPRFNGIMAVLKTVPGAHIVANVTTATQDNSAGFAAMNTILQTTPNVDVVLGSDEDVEGALAALQAAHKATNRQFLGGLDGEPLALADILKGGPYKATVALAPAIFGYAWSEFAARWLAGETIPQAINVVPIALTGKKAIAAYNHAENRPGAVWNDPKLLKQYLGFYGAISYATRRSYLAYTYAGQ
jgi:ribose transport system substrate-binding protein